MAERNLTEQNQEQQSEQEGLTMQSGAADGMERVNRICSQPLWKEQVQRIAQLEQDRKYCGHDLTHFLDVARLAYIEALERGLAISKELIYAAALLHDIGRAAQYEDGIPHDTASAAFAAQLLPDCGFSKEEQTQILDAISGHRKKKTGERGDLAGLIYRADKRSRMCLFCGVQESCSWSTEKKNLQLFL